jgi:6-phosphogluconate dehydrogenase
MLILMQRTVGVLGLGDMGSNVAERLHGSGYSLVLYNRSKERYASFQNRERISLAKDLDDFVQVLRGSGEHAVIWTMLPGGAVTNTMMQELSTRLRRGDIVIDASNSRYTDSIANHALLRDVSVSYLDVGCAGGPSDLLRGVSLMVGGDRDAYERAEGIFRVLAGKGAYGYVGASGAGHMAKLVHNGIFYGTFPIYAEGIELLLKMKEGFKGEFDMGKALQLLASSPPINGDIMEAISASVQKGELPASAPEMKVSEMITWEAGRAEKLGIRFNATRAVLDSYSKLSETSRRIYAAAKKIVTGH